MVEKTEDNAGGWGPLGTAICPWLETPLGRLLGMISQDRLGHAWLIHGREGIGKFNLARYFARRVLSGDLATQDAAVLDAAGFARGMADRQIAGDHHPDLHEIHPLEDKTTISIEQVRDACEILTLKSFAGRAKVIIIHPAEALTVAAANALLKTLEEPPGESYLLLVSHRPGRLPATIRSRCQAVCVRGPSARVLSQWAGAERLSGLPDLVQLSPLELVADAGYLDTMETLAEEFGAALSGGGDLYQLADKWSKGDLIHALGWLAGFLRFELRLRALGSGSNPVTETYHHRLHNLVRGKDARTIFQQLTEVENLRDAGGSGINMQAALRSVFIALRFG